MREEDATFHISFGCRWRTQKSGTWSSMEVTPTSHYLYLGAALMIVMTIKCFEWHSIVDLLCNVFSD